MLRTIVARSTYPMPAGRSPYPSAMMTSARFSVRPRSRPSSFTDWRELWPPVSRRNFHPGPSVYSAAPRTSLDEHIRVELENGATYKPRNVTVNDKDLAGHYRQSAMTLIGKVREKIIGSTALPAEDKAHLHGLPRTTLEKDFFPIFQRIANAAKVMIFCGRNTIEGKLTPEGPVSAAIAAYTLYKCHKVAIIVSDEPNKRLIQAMLTDLDPKCGKFITYLPINQVNGTLLGTLHRQIDTRKPDVTVYIDVPGRNKNGHYLDAQGLPIALANVAFDQALNLQNALGMETIAICSGINSAGFPASDAVTAGSHNDDLRAVLSASHSLVVPNVIAGTLGLMELVSTACTDLKACEAAQLKAVLAIAAGKIEDKSLQAPVLRKMSRPRPAWREAAPAEITDEHPAIQALKSIHEVIDASDVVWPASLEKIKFSGPEIRHVILFDSSDGVLIATEDFLDYVRARSNFQIKVHAVADHEKRPYGRFLPDELFNIVVNGIAYCAALKGDVIVMVCNTACTVGVDRAKAVVEKWLSTMGLHYKVEIIDLIKTVATAIVDEGGPEPVLLSTQATAESHAYPRAVEASARLEGKEPPSITVIGCGNRDKRPQDDWATFVNNGAYDPKEPDHQDFLFAVKSYVHQIPLSASSVWLCCTHFPVLRDFIRKFLNERLVAHGMPEDSIPIIDPLSYQTEATIAYLERTKPVKGKDYGALRSLAVSTTGRYEEVGRSVKAHIKREKPPVFEVAFPHVPLGHETAPPASPGN